MQILCFFFFYSRAAVSVVFSTLLSCSGFIMCSLFASCIFIWTNKDDDDDDDDEYAFSITLKSLWSIDSRNNRSHIMTSDCCNWLRRCDLLAIAKFVVVTVPLSIRPNFKYWYRKINSYKHKQHTVSQAMQKRLDVNGYKRAPVTMTPQVQVVNWMKPGKYRSSSSLS